ncbi:tripartite tricarboxylate transporter TctB family protein [Pseudoroseicyclus tamaricis]|uniref:Tripartite tricarboxylate transporter TctB family protein n=1 Tax=Pseudoroseicyclus tamaricis TaxID=2705421 RepID=A0A6B2K251_9RHOB|nr:tripartite tricarboxylate transporter TctB family protein [Pseudoroseicyclus tamaricis]NDV00496.1 tripartite tricarboxylate transporter TctB family protein [Pseudoroseicyclus tamaricis]
MSAQPSSRLTRPETITAIGIVIIAGALLIPAAGLRPISALLPVAMLVGLIILSVFLLIADQRKATLEQKGEREPAGPLSDSPKRALGAFALIVLYALAVDVAGFYASTIVMLPLVTYTFGYRSLPRIALATVIVVGAIYLIFSVGMSQNFPTGMLWES